MTKLNFSDLVAIIGYPLTKKKLMYNCTSLYCYDIGNGSVMSSIVSDFGWTLVILPCNKGVADPQMSLTRLMSLMVRLKFLISFFLIIDLKLAVLGHPMISCNFLELLSL